MIRLQKMQNVAAWIVLQCHRCTHVLKRVFTALRCNRRGYGFNYHTYTMAYMCLDGLNGNFDAHSHNTRQSSRLKRLVPRARLECSIRKCPYSGALIWNDLPEV